MPFRSIAVILSTNGSALDAGALGELPAGRLVRVEFAWGDRASCVAATVEHDCSTAELAAQLRRWAGSRGWSVTIAPVGGGR